MGTPSHPELAATQPPCPWLVRVLANKLNTRKKKNQSTWPLHANRDAAVLMGGRRQPRRAAASRPGTGRMPSGQECSRSGSARIAPRCTASFYSSPPTRPSPGCQSRLLRRLRVPRSSMSSRRKSRRRRCREVPATRGSGALRSALQPNILLQDHGCRTSCTRPCEPLAGIACRAYGEHGWAPKRRSSSLPAV